MRGVPVSEDVFAPDVPTLVARIEAVAASNFRRGEVLARVLRGFSDAKARKAA